jgi:hypothetical protein
MLEMLCAAVTSGQVVKINSRAGIHTYVHTDICSEVEQSLENVICKLLIICLIGHNRDIWKFCFACINMYASFQLLLEGGDKLVLFTYMMG